MKSEHIEKAAKAVLDEQGGDLMATLAEQWIEEGIERGMIQEAREMVLEAVSSRFGTVQEDIEKEINAFEDRMRLKDLLRQAIVCSDLTGFRNALREARG